MNDNSISIVPRLSNYPANGIKAKEILDWLVSLDIVKPTLSNCILGSGKGYSISDGARQVTNSPEELPYELITNGLSIITDRKVFDTGENFTDEIICPNCKENIVFDEWNINPWNNQETNSLNCPQCGHETDINNYIFKPDWGFSDLGFTFWNWPDFKDEFINEFKQKLDCDISIVYQYI